MLLFIDRDNAEAIDMEIAVDLQLCFVGICLHINIEKIFPKELPNATFL